MGAFLKANHGATVTLSHPTLANGGTHAWQQDGYMFHLDFLDYSLSIRDTKCDPKFDVFKKSATTTVLGDVGHLADVVEHVAAREEEDSDEEDENEPETRIIVSPPSSSFPLAKTDIPSHVPLRSLPTAL